MIVMKFGGSSVDSTEALARVVRDVRSALPRRPVVVISAMGKTTNRLLAAAARAAGGDLEGARAEAAELRAFHAREAGPAVPPGSLDALLGPHFATLDQALVEVARAGELSPRLSDQVASHGELLASALLAAALARAGIPATGVDCRKVIVTDDTFTRAQPDYATTDERLRAALPPLLAAGKVPVVGGYVGATRAGVTTTLGKEGSDFSAAIVGAALGAEEVLILTDVPGILTADPRLVPGARRVPELTFAEALELACSGSKKPHPGTLGPARSKGVPLRVVSARQPDGPGTRIGGPRALGSGGQRPAIRSIVCRANAHLLYALADPAHAGNGFLPGVLSLCERFRPALLVLGTTGAGVPLALDRDERLEEVRAALETAAQVGVVPGRSVVSLVSEDLAASPALVERALAVTAEWEPRLVIEGAACPAVRFLVDEAHAAAAVATVHARLFGDAKGEP